MRANMDRFDCVVPSLPRNRNFGATGSSMNNAVFQRDISTVGFYAGKEYVDFGNVDYLLNENYEKHIRELVQTALPLERPSARDVNAPKVTIQHRDCCFSFCKPSHCFIRQGVVYLLLYGDTARFQEFANYFKIWTHPRSHYHFLQLLEFDGSIFLIADVRFCDLLPDYHRILPSTSVTIVPGAQALTCDASCAARGMICSASDMPWLNSCTVLKKYFPCERGCILEAGADIPSYVSDVRALTCVSLKICVFNCIIIILCSPKCLLMDFV
jgi:hypothetical protein